MFKTQSEECEAACRAVEEERRLEREERRHEQEERLEREEARRAEDRERERRREQRLKAERALELKRRDTPKLKRMTEDADVDEYMYDFERYVGSLEIPEEEWVIYLLPLLSESANRAVKTLDLHEQQIYKKVKGSIIQNCEAGPKRLGEVWWTCNKKKGQSYVELVSKRVRLLDRYLTGVTTMH